MERRSCRLVIFLLTSTLVSMGIPKLALGADEPTAWKDCTGSSWDIGIRRLRVVQYEGNPQSDESEEQAIALVTALTPSLVGKNIFWLGLQPSQDWERCTGQTPVFLFFRSISGAWEIVQVPALEHLQSQLQRLPSDQIETPPHALILFAIARLPSVSYETKLTNLIKAMQILSEKGDPTQLVPEITDELVNQCADTSERHEARNNALKRFAKMRAEDTVCTVDYLPMTKVPPVFPERAKRRRKEGVSIVEFTVGVDGKPRDAVIIQESPEGFGFGRAHLRALAQWTYRPRVVDGVPTEAKGVRNTLSFSLD